MIFAMRLFQRYGSEFQEVLHSYKRDNHQLQMSHDLLGIIIDNLDGIISLHDIDGTYLYYKGPKRYGVSASDFQRKRLTDVFSFDDASKIIKQIKQVFTRR